MKLLLSFCAFQCLPIFHSEFHFPSDRVNDLTYPSNKKSVSFAGFETARKEELHIDSSVLQILIMTNGNVATLPEAIQLNSIS